AHRQGRGRQGEDVHHAGEDLPHPGAGLLMIGRSSTPRATARTRHAGGIRSRRGVALILVLTTIAILTSVAVDFGYQSRVNLRLTENARDELRAYYLARSAARHCTRSAASKARSARRLSTRTAASTCAASTGWSPLRWRRSPSCAR